ncbi:MAG: hypothetical protein AAB496_01050 [Patescibacteria group bacterium]
MREIIISKKSTKCKKCKSTTFKIEYKKGPDPERFLLTINQLMCARCGYICLGELSDKGKEKMKVPEKNYQKMLNQHKRFKETGYIDD